MLKKIFIGFSIFVFLLYALFLIVPVFLTGFVNSYSTEISKIVEESCGFKLKLEKLKVVTTPKLTVGLKAGHIEVALPTGESFFTADNVQGKLSLLPVILRKIEIDMVGADNVNLNLKIKKDGKFFIEDYIPQNTDEQSVQTTSLPLGIKLSNRLPDIIINNYNISLIDAQTDKSYSIFGEKLSIKDFVLNKKVKIVADGKVMLQEREQFSYDIKVFNKIMPDINLNDLVFAQQTENEPAQNMPEINIIEIFKAIYNNQLSADLKTDIKTSGTFEDMNLDGYVNVSNLSAAVDGKKLPVGNLNIKMSGNKINLYTKLFTAEKEITELAGDFRTGKHPKIDLNCKSNAQFKSIIDLFDSVAKSFGYKDLDTLTATGGLDADFTVKSDLKKIESSGYLKIPSGSISYGLYKIAVEKIFADIQFANNSIEIKESGFNILGQPLKLKGTISQDASTDINLTADKLQIKGLLLAAGQIALLKENNINSGTVSLDVILKGKADKIIPKVNVIVDNVNVKNIPSNTTVTVANSKINLTTDGKKTDGSIDINNVKILNPMANISAPKANILLGEKDIDIKNAYILLNNSRIDITGKIADYMTKNINFDINAKGNLIAADIISMIPKDFRSEVSGAGKVPLNVNITGNDKNQNIDFKLSSNPSNYLALLNIEQLKGKSTEIKGDIKISGDTLKFSDTGIYTGSTSLAPLKGGINDLYKSQKLNLNVSTSENVSFVIPYFKKSKMTAGGNIDVTGNLANPILKGNVSVPSISIPDMQLTTEDLSISLNGPIAKGHGTLKKLVSGGIAAENLSSDFNLTNNVFYLKNLTGEAFDGKINGDISYNIVNGNIGVDIKGSDMNAEKAIAGAAGIKNALSGKLGFSANITTHGATDVEMMKYLKGKASFEISDGELGNIGRFENMILAQNILANPIMKSAVNSVKSLPVIKNTAEFKSISGNLTFSDGWANLNPVKTSGPSMAYYITGKYNLLNGTANVVILGRISAEVVKLLGPVGELSVSKLTSLIPGIGSSTLSLINAMTTNPNNEKISEIPALSSGNTNYKDFKVQFNGGVESSSSVKSFKWLSNCDTSGIESVSIKDQIQTTKQAVQETAKQQIDNVTKKLEEQRQQAQEANQQMKDTVEGLKKLFKTPTKTPTAE